MADEALEEVVEAMAEEFYDRVRSTGSLSFAAMPDRQRAKVVEAMQNARRLASNFGWKLKYDAAPSARETEGGEG